MLYLLDANIIIHASNTYYKIDRVKPFWEWLIEKAREGHVKVPFEIIGEIKNSNRKDLLYDWIRNQEHHDALLLNEEVDVNIVQDVIRRGYANDLTDEEVEGLGMDPFLIAYAVGHPDRCVVTNEARTNKRRHNRRIPDVCQDFGVQWCNVFKLNDELDFRIPGRA